MQWLAITSEDNYVVDAADLAEATAQAESLPGSFVAVSIIAPNPIAIALASPDGSNWELRVSNEGITEIIPLDE